MSTFLYCTKPSKRVKCNGWRNFLEKNILNKRHVSNFLWADRIIRTFLRSHLWESKSSYKTKRNPRKAVLQGSSGGYLPNPHPKELYQSEIYHQQPTQNLNTKERMKSRAKQKLHMQHTDGSFGNSLICFMLSERFLWTLQSVFLSKT